MARRNWKRGLFRVWIVFAGLWVLVVGLIFFVELSPLPLNGQMFIVKHPDDNPTLERVTGDTEEEFIKRIDIKGGGDPEKLLYWETTPLGYRTLLGREWSAEKSKERLREVDEMIREQANAKWWDSLYDGAKIAFGVPVVVLALGSAFAWAFSGFRREEGK